MLGQKGKMGPKTGSLVTWLLELRHHLMMHVPYLRLELNIT